MDSHVCCGTCLFLTSIECARKEELQSPPHAGSKGGKTHIINAISLVHSMLVTCATSTSFHIYLGFKCEQDYFGETEGYVMWQVTYALH